MSCNNSPNVRFEGSIGYRSPSAFRSSGCGCGAVQARAPVVRENFTAGAGCTLSAPPPAAGCCHPAPLHCSGESCGVGYFKASEAYGSS